MDISTSYRSKFKEALQAFMQQLEGDSRAWLSNKIKYEPSSRGIYASKKIEFKNTKYLKGYIKVYSFEDGKKRWLCSIEYKTGDIYKPWRGGLEPQAMSKRGNIFEKETFQNMDYFGGWLNRGE